MCQEFAGFFLQMISGLIVWELKILGNFCLFFYFLLRQIYLLHYLLQRPSSAQSETVNDKITHFLVYYVSYGDPECPVLKLLLEFLSYWQTH